MATCRHGDMQAWRHAGMAACVPRRQLQRTRFSSGTAACVVHVPPVVKVGQGAATTRCPGANLPAPGPLLTTRATPAGPRAAQSRQALHCMKACPCQALVPVVAACVLWQADWHGTAASIPTVTPTTNTAGAEVMHALRATCRASRLLGDP